MVVESGCVVGLFWTVNEASKLQNDDGAILILVISNSAHHEYALYWIAFAGSESASHPITLLIVTSCGKTNTVSLSKKTRPSNTGVAYGVVFP